MTTTAARNALWSAARDALVQVRVAHDRHLPAMAASCEAMGAAAAAFDAGQVALHAGAWRAHRAPVEGAKHYLEYALSRALAAEEAHREELRVAALLARPAARPDRPPVIFVDPAGPRWAAR